MSNRSSSRRHGLRASNGKRRSFPKITGAKFRNKKKAQARRAEKLKAAA